MRTFDFYLRVFIAALLVPCWAGASEGGLSDEAIAAALARGCGRESPIESHDGFLNRRSTIGPLWLTEAGDKVERGLILPPYLRVYLFGRSHRCGKVTVEDARDLARAEVWVVLWRLEDPPGPPGVKRVQSSQRVFRPAKVRYYHQKTWVDPLWTRQEDGWMSLWFWDQWKDDGLLVAFPDMDRAGALDVEYTIDERDGRSYLTDSANFTLGLLREKWWHIAFGEEIE